MTSPFTQTPNFVIPAKAEIHGLTVPRGGQSRPWIPDQVGNDKIWCADAVCGEAA